MNGENNNLTYTIMVLSGGYGSQNAYLAYQFSQVLINKKHCIHSVFFYMDGVHNANPFIDPANDEFNLLNSWKTLHDEYGISLNVCLSSARRRGIIPDHSCASFFSISGLQALNGAIDLSDRLIQF